VEVVVGPAMGGVILSHATASELTRMLKRDIPGVYAEKTGDGGFDFTRGYGDFVKGKKFWWSRMFLLPEVLLKK